MKKIIFICLLCLIFCGCTVNYNIVIDDKKNISEAIVINYSKSKLIGYDMSLEEFAKNRNEAYKQILNEYGFKSEYNIENNILTFNLKRENSSLKKINEMYEFQKIYNLISIIENEDGYTLKTDGDYNGIDLFKSDEEYGSTFNLDNLVINIQFYNKIIKSNADSCDENTNTCTWKYDSKTTEKTIEVELSNEVLEQFVDKRNMENDDNINSNIVIIVIILSLFIIIAIISWIVIIIYKRRNQI